MSTRHLGPDVVSVLDTLWLRGPSTVAELARIHGVAVKIVRRILRNAHGRGWAIIDFDQGEWALTVEGFLFLEEPTPVAS